MTLSAQIGYMVPQEYEIYQAGRGTTQTYHKTIHQTKKIMNILWPGLCGDDPLTTVRLPQSF